MKIILPLFIFALTYSCAHSGKRMPASFQHCEKAIDDFLFQNRLNQNIDIRIPKSLIEKKGTDLILVNDSKRVKVDRLRRKFQRLLRRSNYGDPIVQNQLESAGLKLQRAKRELGKGIINSTLIKAAVQSNTFILTRAINKGAYSFIGHRAVLKPTYIKAKTAKRGLIKGLIPVDQSLVQENLPLDSTKYFQAEVDRLLKEGLVQKEIFENSQGIAVVRNNNIITVEQPLPTDKPVEVLLDLDGNFFTADIDLFAIAHKRKINQPIKHYDQYGITNEQEIESIQNINHIFTQYDTHRNIQRDLVFHGSEAFNPKPGDIEFPIRAYIPDGRVFDIPSGPEEDRLSHLRSFYTWVAKQGYFLPKNSNWKI